MASAAPLRDLDGRVRGAVALFDDISVLKQLERMREEWMAVIAHDLRQPLNGIVLHAQVLRRALGPGAPERQLESIEHIRVAGLRLNRMIEDLLDASRIEASRLKLERRPLALPRLVGEIVARTSELAGRQVRVSAQEGVPEAFADPGRIEQVLSNLLTNAAKYGDREAAIEVHIGRDGADVRVSVTNEGAAIDEAHLSHLFTRFYRTPSAEAGPRRGLGLGLYISKGLIEAHGGRIRAESYERRTTFHFTLPPATPSPEVAAAPAA
jgi:signal transduction histidine kinase